VPALRRARRSSRRVPAVARLRFNRDWSQYRSALPSCRPPYVTRDDTLLAPALPAGVSKASARVLSGRARECQEVGHRRLLSRANLPGLGRQMDVGTASSVNPVSSAARLIAVGSGRERRCGYASVDAACARTAGGRSRRWQATWWPGSTSRISGSSCEQRVNAWGQRVRKRQPEGGLIGLGTSPLRMMRRRAASGSGTGTADRSASV